MKPIKFLLLFLFSLLFVACDLIDDNGTDDPNLEPIVLSGTESSPLVLENLFNDPDRVDYIIEGLWRIDAKVEVEPGVRISMTSSSGIQVRSSGSLSAVGTADNPIFFEGEVEAAGYWNYITFESNNPANRLEYCIIRHGGGSSLTWYSAMVNVRNNSQGSIVNTVISDSQRNGLRIEDTSSRLQEFRDNTFANNTLFPIVLRTSQMHSIDNTTVFTSGNGFNQIEVRGNTVTNPMTVNPASGPYVLKGSSNFNAPVEILPGTLIEMGPSANIQVGSSGSLKAIGTDTERITFIAEQEAKGYWDYIHFGGSSSPNNQFKFVDISYGGGSTLTWHAAAISMNSGSFLSMENSSVTNSQRWGVHIRGGSTFEDLGGNIFSGNELGDID